jgi:ubiquitin-conjugating enzyme E2 D/E
MAAIRRLTKEFHEINETKPNDQQNLVYSIQPVNNNLFEWHGYIFGPTGTPYQGGAFEIEIKCPTNYPFKPPAVTFKTRIFHPNISATGTICLDILKDKWSPALTISKVLLSVISLLNEPNPDDPLEPNTAELMKTNRKAFEHTATQWTQKYAGGN